MANLWKAISWFLVPVRIEHVMINTIQLGQVIKRIGHTYVFLFGFPIMKWQRIKPWDGL